MQRTEYVCRRQTQTTENLIVSAQEFCVILSFFSFLSPPFPTNLICTALIIWWILTKLKMATHPLQNMWVLWEQTNVIVSN
jgi:hypothetical protein